MRRCVIRDDEREILTQNASIFISIVLVDEWWFVIESCADADERWRRSQDLTGSFSIRAFAISVFFKNTK